MLPIRFSGVSILSVYIHRHNDISAELIIKRHVVWSCAQNIVQLETTYLEVKQV